MNSLSEEVSCLDDVKQHAKRSLTVALYSFIAGGSEDQQTIQENRKAFRRIMLRPRMLRGITHVDMRTTILGNPVSMPICISPSAAHARVHPDGEIATVKAAAHHDTCMILSMFSTCTLEEVAIAAPNTHKWFLTYMLRDRERLKALVKRVEDAGYRAIVLCVDSPNPAAYLHRAVQKYGHPKSMGKKLVHMPPEYHNDRQKVIEQEIKWECVDWLKSATRLPIVLKGIMTSEDAVLAVQHGVDAILVSNHGGRQLDTVPATIEVLPEIVDAVQGKLEIYLDGGVRLGTDVLKALALGARAVFLGRPVLWGLAYKGEEGVKKVLDMIREEFRLAMILSGNATLRDICRDHVTSNTRLAKLC